MPEEILRHLHAAPPPTPPPFHVQRQVAAEEIPPPPPAPPRPQLRSLDHAMVEPPPPMPQQPRDQVTLAMQVINTARTVAAIMASRILLLIALLCASVLWGVTIYDPLPNRIVSAAIFSAVVLWPLIILTIRKG